MHPAIDPAIGTPTVGATTSSYTAHNRKKGFDNDWEGAGPPPWIDAREIVMGDYCSGYNGLIDWRPFAQAILIAAGVTEQFAAARVRCLAPEDIVRPWTGPGARAVLSDLSDAPTGRCSNCAHCGWDDCLAPEFENIEVLSNGLSLGSDAPCPIWRLRQD